MREQLSYLSSLCLQVWLLIQCFEGILRFELEKRGLASLIYARDLLLIVVLCAALYDGATFRNGLIIFCTALVFGLGTFVGLLGSSPSQVIFGLKILFPVIVGVAYGCSKLTMPPLTTQALILFSACMFGLTWNFFQPQLPWTGGSQEVMGVQVVNSRQWHAMTGGSENILRPAGFARASYAVSNELLWLGTFILVRARKEWRFAVWALVLLGCAMTTMKGALLCWGAITLAYGLSLMDPDDAGWTRRWFVNGLAAFVVGVPCLIFLDNFENIKFRHGTVAAALTDSFAERLTLTWPEAYRIAESGVGGVFFGRGIGGIGMPVAYFTEDIHNSADNIFVFLFVVFGLIAFPIFWAFIHAMHRLMLRIDPSEMDNLTLWFTGVGLLTYGSLGAMIEDPLCSISMGAIIARGLSNHPIFRNASDLNEETQLSRHPNLY